MELGWMFNKKKYHGDRKSNFRFSYCRFMLGIPFLARSSTASHRIPLPTEHQMTAQNFTRKRTINQLITSCAGLCHYFVRRNGISCRLLGNALCMLAPNGGTHGVWTGKQEWTWLPRPLESVTTVGACTACLESGWAANWLDVVWLMREQQL